MVISRRVELDRDAGRYVVTSRHADGSETSKVYHSDREFEQMLQNEARRLELKAELAESKEERSRILDELDRHLFCAQVYGFAIRSKHSIPLRAEQYEYR